MKTAYYERFVIKCNGRYLMDSVGTHWTDDPKQAAEYTSEESASEDAQALTMGKQVVPMVVKERIEC